MSRTKKTKKKAEPKLDYIHPLLRQFAVPVGDLNLDPENARRHGERNVSAIATSMADHKQLIPIVVQEQGMVVRSGNGRLMAARNLGWTHIAALVVDKENVDAVAFALADNRTAELATWDMDQLAANLKALAEQGWENFTAVGFDDGEVAALLATSRWEGVDLDQLPQGDDKGSAPSVVKVYVDPTLELEAVRESLRQYCERKYKDAVTVK